MGFRRAGRQEGTVTPEMTFSRTLYSPHSRQPSKEESVWAERIQQVSLRKLLVRGMK